MSTKIIAISNQKGGVGKTTTSLNLGIGLAKEGYRVLMIDADPQGSLTMCLGYPNPNELDVTLNDVLGNIILNKSFTNDFGILETHEKVFLLPANDTLASMENNLANVTVDREFVLTDYIDQVKDDYDYIFIDCMPSLGMLTLNALVAANSVIIPTQAQHLSAMALEEILKTIARIRKRLNPSLTIDGILMTMVDIRTNYSMDVMESIKNAYGKDIRIFQSYIPRSVRVEETSAIGQSIYLHDPQGKVAKAYEDVVEELVLND